MSCEGAAVVAFTTGMVAGILARADGPLACDVYAPEFDEKHGQAVLPVSTAGGLKLEIVVREVAS